MTPRAPSTMIPAVLRAFHEELAARPGLLAFATDGVAPTKVPVDLGWPTGGPQARHVWIDGSVSDWVSEWITTATGADGTVAYDERFTVTVNVLWSTPRAEFAQLLDETFALVAEVDQQLLDDFTLAGTADLASLIGGDFAEDVTAEGGRRLFVERRIAVTTSWPRTDG